MGLICNIDIEAYYLWSGENPGPIPEEKAREIYDAFADLVGIPEDFREFQYNNQGNLVYVEVGDQVDLPSNAELRELSKKIGEVFLEVEINGFSYDGNSKVHLFNGFMKSVEAKLVYPDVDLKDMMDEADNPLRPGADATPGMR